MKKIFLYLLVLSVGCNIFFVIRRMDRVRSFHDFEKLRFYKDISYREGYTYFSDQMKLKYPETPVTKKYSIAYVWDSTMYDYFHRDQMKALDSVAGSHERAFEFIFVTEMEERPTAHFLKSYNDEFKHAKMLYGMDDFISGLHNIEGLKLTKAKVIGKVKSGDCDYSKMKQKPFYVIMDQNGKIIYVSETMFVALRDTAFLNKLHALAPAANAKLLD